MIPVRGYAAPKAGAPLEPFSFDRREPGDDDVLIDILFAGICHSDIHSARGEWGEMPFPMVPGHEIVGKVSRVGKNVSRFAPGDTAGVGCFVDSCRACEACNAGLQNYCDQVVFTYGAHQKDGKTVTQGGYSSRIVVDEEYVLRIPPALAPERAAPLLCAGITTYSPLRHWNVSKGQRVGILGLGGLGHMAVKIAASLGAEVTVLSTSAGKEADARRLGAHHFVLTSRSANLLPLRNHFDFILDTVSAPHPVDTTLELLRRDGTMTLVGAPPDPLPVQAFSLILRRRRLAGSLIGGLPETQTMIDYCAARNLGADVEVIPVQDVNKAYDRVVRGDVRYRFVIDVKTL